MGAKRPPAATGVKLAGHDQRAAPHELRRKRCILPGVHRVDLEEQVRFGHSEPHEVESPDLGLGPSSPAAPAHEDARGGAIEVVSRGAVQAPAERWGESTVRIYPCTRDDEDVVVRHEAYGMSN